MRVLDLFSGIGGFSLGLERAGMETVAFCEYDTHAQKILKKHWPEVPIHKDVRTLNGNQYKGKVEVICGGYPCQPFSQAGKQRGTEDDRHLWPEYLRLIREIKPKWVIAENVVGHIRLGLDQVLSDLEAEDYATETYNIPACGLNAHHRRQRIWIVAHSNLQSEQVHTNSSPLGLQGCTQESFPRVSDLQSKLIGSGETIAYVSDSCESPVLGVTNGFPRRVDRVKRLGNAVVPQIPEMLGMAIMQWEKNYG